MATKRLRKELTDFNNNPPEGWTPGYMNDADLFLWEAKLKGPAGSPYEGGVFSLDIRFSTDYPLRPPDPKFTTKIYHCNITSFGMLNLDIVKDWYPTMTVVEVLAAIRALLVTPNPAAPLVRSIATQYLTDRPAHDKTAVEWTKMYARG